jgi:hypothetical protein
MPKLRDALVLAFSLVACGGKTTDDATTDAAAPTDTATSADTRADSGVDFAACSQPGTCMLATNGCCGVCGTPKLSDLSPINTARAADFQKFPCSDPSPTCPGCATMNDPNLQAFCRGGRCTGVDLRADALSSCATDDDCTLRYEACCECGASGDSNIVAIRRDKLGAYSSERCPPSTGCPECAPAYPSTLRAVCDPTTKHCAVRPA